MIRPDTKFNGRFISDTTEKRILLRGISESMYEFGGFVDPVGLVSLSGDRLKQ